MKSEVKEAAARWIARRDAGWSEAERAEFERWLSADPRHAEALALYNHAWNLFDRPRRTGVADDIWNDLNARSRSRQRRIRMAAASAAVVIAIVVFVQTRAPRSEGAPTPTGAVVLVPEKRALADGSTVDLKPGAAIAISFTGAWRRVTLQHGEAHFQVASDPLRPFLVTAGGIEFRATGTAFSVQLGTGAVELLVTEGRVAVEKLPPVSAASELPANPLAVVPAGNRVLVNLTAGREPSLAPVTAVSKAEQEERLAWRAPRIEFSGTPLLEAIAVMNRYTRIQMSLGDPALFRLELSGYFRADNTEAFLRVLEATLDIKAERSADRVILRPSQ
jgi:transmembrane sensor